MYMTGSTANDIYGANPGTIIITSNDPDKDVIKGTFSFTATPSFGNTSTAEYEITTGSFTLNY